MSHAPHDSDAPALDPTVRPAEIDDATAIAALHVRAWQVAYRGIIADSYLDSLSLDLDSRTDRWRLRIAQPEEPGMVTLVAEIGGKVVGWVNYGPSRDPDASEAEGKIGEIWGIYVNPASWRQRAGAALIGKATEGLTATGYSEATLWVLEGNARARGFYERWGWRPDGASDWLERDGQQAVEIRYRLPLT